RSAREGAALRGRRDLRRGGWRARRARDHARRVAGVLRRPRPHPGGHRREVRGRTLLRIHGARWRRALREDGAQRHRVRRYAVHRRGLRPPSRLGDDRARDRGRVRGVERGGTRVLPHRDHRDRVAPDRSAHRRRLVDIIADAAAQKGTGMWTVKSGLDIGVPVHTIAESVCARAVSSHPQLRSAGQESLTGPDLAIETHPGFVDHVRDALYSAKVVAYAQGLDQIRTASEEYEWNIDIADVAKIWRAGCIIRARLLEQIRSEYAGANLPTLLT